MVDCRPLLDNGRNKNEELRTFDILSSLNSVCHTDVLLSCEWFRKMLLSTKLFEQYKLRADFYKRKSALLFVFTIT